MNQKPTKYSPAVRKAIEKYGEHVCLRAYVLNTKHGEGASSVALAYCLPGINTTRQADSAINAGAAIAHSLRTKP
jgi:hypothetical protein